MARQVTDAPVASEQRVPMTYEEWLAWPGSQGRVTEWVDGQVIVFDMPSKFHQDILGFLYVLLSWYVRALGLGAVIMAPFEMRLSPRRSREPDIVFVAHEHADRLDATRLDGPADLAVEIVSPDSARRDQQEKLEEYAALGVREYWVFDSRPGRQDARFYQLGPDGRYGFVPPDADGRYHSTMLPGFWLRPDWLWQEPLPEPDRLKPAIAPAVWRATLAAMEPE